MGVSDEAKNVILLNFLRKSKKKMPSRIAMTQSIMRLCTVRCREKNAIIPIVYLNNPFQDSTNA
jgi:hypothetical protein